MRSGAQATASLNIITDNVFIRFFPDGLRSAHFTLPIIGEVSIAVFLMYLVLPILLVLIGLMIAEQKKAKEIFQSSI